MLRSIASVAAVVVLSLTVAACSRHAESSNRFADPSQEAAEKVAEKADETARAAAVFAQEKKREFEEKIQIELKNFDNLIADLRIKAKSAESEARDVLDRAVEDLEAKKGALQKRLSEFGSATAGASQRIQAAVEAALEDLKKSYGQAAAELK